ncbi:MAG: hypothetical protein IPP33_08360 [Flavobacteriales bacterium]|nr:hypothetical protein [Flavobacteriales bacterium]
MRDQMNAITTDPTGRVGFGGSAGVYIGFDPQHHPVTPMPAGSLGSSMVLATATDHAGYWATRFYYDRTLYALDGRCGYDSIAIPQAKNSRRRPGRPLLHATDASFSAPRMGCCALIQNVGPSPYATCPILMDTHRTDINDLIETPDGDLGQAGTSMPFAHAQLRPLRTLRG